MPADILLSQKIFAVFNRPRNKGRDFYDIVFLLGKKIKPNYKYLEQKINIATSTELKKKLTDKLSSIDFNEMSDDVRPFLFNSLDDKKVLLFDKYISQVDF